VVTRCFGVITSSWDIFLGKLAAYKERFGHCNVESDWDEDTYLAGWVTTQRGRKKKGALSSERIERLDALGFVWNWHKVKSDETWMKWYRELEAYTREHGNPHVPRSHSNSKLKNWVLIQRQRRKGTLKYKEGCNLMTDEQMQLLDKIGFRWDAREGQWKERLKQLKLFKEENGHCNVQRFNCSDDEFLSWVKTQRLLSSDGNIDANRKAQLDELGFFELEKINPWEVMYEKLKQYHAINGNVHVPNKWKDDLKLAFWVSQQRQKRKKNLLSHDQIQLLDSLGFIWYQRRRGRWEDRFDEVVEFKAKSGHCDIPLNYPVNPKLGQFVNSMRTRRKNGSLSADRIAKLDAIGFNWVSSRKILVGGEGITEEWQVAFDNLLEYYKAHGNCSVPNTWSENPKLGRWVRYQRYLKKQNKLHPKRQEKLDEIGFNWNFDKKDKYK
ncbi:MAG: helicase associated domain-containing protein, partial [Proteobacteria bacterium]|nr:helicase associated domain-containing protein [Pseudomonadota bacterium]